MPSLLPTTVGTGKVLKYTISRGSEQQANNTLTQTELDYFLKRFGPFRLSITKAASNFFRNGQLVEWFHGSISRADSVRILADLQPGKFLMRYSEERPRNFTLCYVNSEQQVRHVLIYNYLERGYGLQENPARATRDEMFDSIVEFVDRQRERLCRPCVSSLYQQFLTDNTPEVTWPPRPGDPSYVDGSALQEPVAGADDGNMYGVIDPRFQQERMAAFNRPELLRHDIPLPVAGPGAEYAAFGTTEFNPATMGLGSPTAVGRGSPMMGGGGAGNGYRSPPPSAGPMNNAYAPLAVPAAMPSPSMDEYAPFHGGMPMPMPLSPMHETRPVPLSPFVPFSPPSYPVTSPEIELKTELDRARSLMQRGSVDQALEIVDRVMPRVLQMNDRNVRLKALRYKGEILTKLERFAESEASLRECVEILDDMYLSTERQDGDSMYFPEAKTLSFVHKQLADHAQRRQDIEAYMYHTEQMMVFDVEQRGRGVTDFARLQAERSSEPVVTSAAADAELETGIKAYYGGQLDVAYESLTRAIRYARLTDNPLAEVRGLANLATVMRAKQDILRAVIFYKQCLATLRRSQPDRGTEKKVLHVLVSCLMQLQQWRRALLFLDQHLKLSQKPENKEMLRKRKEEIMRHIS